MSGATARRRVTGAMLPATVGQTVTLVGRVVTRSESHAIVEAAVRAGGRAAGRQVLAVWGGSARRGV